MTETPLAPRVIRAASWWLAAELVARHPQLRVYETHAHGGLWDCLTIRDEARPIIDLNRAGSLHCYTDEFASMSTHQWTDIVAAPEPVRVVTELEQAAGLSSPFSAPAPAPHVLVYRCAAHILALTVYDERHFDVRSEYGDSSGYDQGPRHYIDEFHHPRLAEGSRPDDLLGIPGYRYWALLVDGKPVALMDTDGYAYFGARAVHLPDRYASLWNSTFSLVGSVFGTVLR